MLRKPKPRGEGILPASKLTLLGVLGSVGTVIALTLFYSFGGVADSPDQLIHAQTMVFNFVVLYEVILTFVIRNSYQVPFFANKWVWGAAALSVTLQAMLMYTPLAPIFKIIPLGLVDLGILFGAGALFAAVCLFYPAMMKRRARLCRC